MSNDYYDGPGENISPNTLARAEAVSQQLTAISEAFDKLPGEFELFEDRFHYVVDSGVADAIVATLPHVPVGYTAGMALVVKVAHDNTGPATINVNALGLKAVKRPDGTDLVLGDLVAGSVVELRYDGTAFRVVAGLANGVPVDIGTPVARAEAAAAQAEADRDQTALDRVQTGLDRVQTGLDSAATGADRVQTGLDRTAVANDRAQTETARDATLLGALTAPQVYANTTDGLAAVAEGETFFVATVDGVALYRDLSGVATLLDILNPTAARLMLGAKTSATLASGTAFGQSAIVSDILRADGGLGVPAWWDGTDWRATHDNGRIPPAPWVDDFDGSSGALSARAGWTVTARTGFASHANGLQVGSDLLTGNNGSVGAAAAGYHDVSSPVGKRFKVRSGGGILRRTALMVSVSSQFTALRFDSNQSGSDTGTVVLLPIVNGVNGSQTTVTQVRPEAYDNWEFVVSKPSSNTLLDIYQNGRQIVAGYSLTGAGLSDNGRFGFFGDLTNAVDHVSIGDSAVDATLTVYSPARVRQTDNSGNITLDLRASYTGEAPTQIKYQLIDTATGNLVTGHDMVSATNLVAANGLLTCRMQASPAVGAGAYAVKLYRTGARGQKGYAPGYTGRQYAGDVVVFFGQSLSVNGNNGSAGTIAAPSNSWRTDATTTVATARDRRQLRMTNDTGAAMFAATMNGLTSNPVNCVQAGAGGTTTTQRLPGSSIHNALLDGLDHGGRALCIIDDSGESDIADAATYTSNQQAIYDAVDAYLGYAAKVLICPVGTMWGSNDANVEALRRAQWKLTQDFPARYALAGWKIDLQHVAADPLHLAGGAASLGEHRRRLAWGALKHKGLDSNGRIGPSLASADLVDAQTLDVTINLNGFDTVEVANALVNGDYRGGLRFSTASSFASTVSPTGASVGTPSGGQVVVRYTFTTGAFPGGVAYVSGPYGSNPFNPSNNSTINANMASQASILRGTKSGEPSVAIQPYYHSSGNDYLVAA